MGRDADEVREDVTQSPMLGEERLVMSYLGRWFDPGLKIPDGLSPHIVEGEECERITIAIATVLYAVTLPRRIGPEASDIDLATDKRRCRRTAHALQQAYRGWTKKRMVLPASDEIRQAGAQLIWSEFQQRHLTELNSRARRAATFAVRSGDADVMRWGKTAITNFNNEHRWFTYALRD